MTKKINKSGINNLAEKVKEYIEKNHKLPSTVTVNTVKYTWPEIWYILSWAINNLNKDLDNVPNVKACTAPTGESINEKIYPGDYKDQAKRIVQYIKQHGQAPNFVTSVKSEKKIHPRLSVYAVARIVVWYNDNHILPGYCTYNSNFFTVKASSSASKSNSTSNCTNPYTSKPHYTEQGVNKLGQATPYYCGPNCVHQGLKKFGITKYSQAKIAAYAGTTSSGTDPSGLESAIQKIAKLEGIKLKVERKYLSDFGSTLSNQFKAIAKLICKPNVFVFTHIGYQDSGEKGGSGYKTFGHYETFDKIDINNNRIRVLNSLGNKCSSNGYCGHLQWRSFSLEKTYINNKTGVKSIWIVSKE